MLIRRAIPVVTLLLLVFILAGCAPAASTPAPEFAPPAAPAPTEAPFFGDLEAPQAAATQAPAATAAAGADIPAASAGYGPQMVVKNGDMRLLVKDTDRALDGITQIVGDVRGYVISSRTWFQTYYGTNYKYATITMSVPVDQFENAQLRLHALAIRVLDDTASGQDVTDQYVDLQSQMTNLQATRDRIKGFLDQAKTVDEALTINAQLADVEAQIEKIKGQMNYLSSRSTFSAITINLEPDLPKIELTPTPTATATPTATPVVIQPLGPWDPGTTTQQATNTLVSVYRVIVDTLIWIFVVLLPIFGPPVLVIWLAVWWIRKRMKPAPKDDAVRPGN